MAHHVEPLEQVIDALTKEIKQNHLARLQAGRCSIELGFILTDLLTDYERISRTTAPTLRWRSSSCSTTRWTPTAT